MSLIVRAIRNGARLWEGIAVPDDLSIGYPVKVNPVITSQSFAIVSVTGSIHQGVDLVVGNVPCVAVEDGDVVSTYLYGRDVPGLGSDGSPGGYGNTVLIHHVTPSGWHYWSYYCHLLPGTISVRYGDRVVRGQQVGITNTTGISSGNHIHFELRSDTVYPTRIDPAPLFMRTVAPPPPEDIFDMLTPEGKAYAEEVFNSPQKRKNLAYALAVMDALENAKPGATPLVVGSSLVTLGPDGRKASELQARVLSEIHRAKKIDPVTRQQIWDEEILDSLVLMDIRQRRQWLLKNNPISAGATPEPPAPGSPADS